MLLVLMSKILLFKSQYKNTGSSAPPSRRESGTNNNFSTLGYTTTNTSKNLNLTGKLHIPVIISAQRGHMPQIAFPNAPSAPWKTVEPEYNSVEHLPDAPGNAQTMFPNMFMARMRATAGDSSYEHSC